MQPEKDQQRDTTTPHIRNDVQKTLSALVELQRDLA